eukprot:CAMPEP_0203695478 /NCGR_PEP_ID=MMETSP0091-20130426/6929_1 /ASSEMBLY_ACC=CAM_ASM_001089 /TAXON_ID=426623 /ORGANISM="Chaetoceros affinis, Strain CCMP159" /LENGTH=249 /DNA_ID=CAMNT_0050567041 /DNA_START=34 /DNA_END=783 /DNA_ORIENTATION=-
MSIDDANSVFSDTSSIGDSLTSIASETERRRAKLQRLRHRRRRSCSNANRDSEISSTRSVNGIMTVRTLCESLNESKITKLSRRRRQAKLQLEHSKKLESRDDEPSIKFGKISIREYGLVPGDNPSVSTGPPVQLDWGNIEHYDGSVDEFESIRDGQRRVQTQMRLPETIRIQLLQLFGHSRQEIDDCARQALIVRKQRFQTFATSEAFPHLEENIERLSRLFSTPFRRNEKRAEQDLWDKVALLTLEN